MSVTEKDANADECSLEVENILADFFLKKIEMKNSRSDHDEEHHRKSKHKKHKKSKHKLKIKSRSSTPSATLNRKVDVERVFSSEEKDIKRLKKIKNIEGRDNKAGPYLPSLRTTERKNNSESHLSITANASNDIDVPYGPSLELLLSGSEVKENKAVSGEDHEDSKFSSRNLNSHDEGIVSINSNVNTKSEIQNNVNPNGKDSLDEVVEPTLKDENACTTSKYTLNDLEANKSVKAKSNNLDIKCVEKHSHESSRSRSRSKSKSRKGSKTLKSKLRHRSRSSSVSISGRLKSRRKKRSYSRDHTRSKRMLSRSRESRSRSKSRDQRSRSRPLWGSRSRIERLRYRHKRSRSKELQRRNKKRSSRSRSKSIKRSRERRSKRSSRSPSRSPKRSRSKSKESIKKNKKGSSRSQSKSAERSRSRSKSKESGTRYKKRPSRSRSKSAKRFRSRSKSKESITRCKKRPSRSRSKSPRRSRSKSKESSKRHKKLPSRSRSKSAKRSRSRSKSKESSKRHKKRSSRSRSKSVRRSRSKSKEKSSKIKHSSRSRSRSAKRSRSKSKELSSKNTKHSSRSRSRSARRSRSKSKEFKRSKRHLSRDRSRSARRSRSKSLESRRSKRLSARDRSRSAPRFRERTRSRSHSRDRYKSEYSSRNKSRRYRSRSRSREYSRSKRESTPSSRSRSKKDSSPAYKSRKSRSKSKEKNSNSVKSNKIDQAKILQIAQKNVLTMIEKGTLPEGLSLDQFKKEQLVSIKSGGKSVQELTDFCTKLSERENDPVDEAKPNVANDSNNQDGESDFIHHPFKLKEHPMIKLNIKNAVQIPIKTHAEKFAETAKLSSQFPVSSGNQHKQKELEWIPVVPDKSKVAQATTEVKTATSKPDVLTQETKKSETVTPASVPSTNTISYIPLPAQTVPALAPPPLPPLLPPPLPSPLLLATTTHVSNQPDTSSNVYSVPAPVSYPAPSSCSPFPLVPNDPIPPAPDAGLPTIASLEPDTTFKPTKHIDVSSIVAKRFKALTKLQEDANDASALQTLHEAHTSIQEWVASQQVPGLFTGSTDAKLLTVEELCGPKHWNYRVKKDIFTRAAPVTEGKGMSLLKKMGWNPGEGLGKNKEGSLEPLLLDVKTDKKGLVSMGEGGKKPTSSVLKELQGKHPVSALMELCSKRKWKPPLYSIVKDQGPPHKKIFLFKVEVNGVDYLPVSPSSNKKFAKADAAIVCLQALNVFPK